MERGFLRVSDGIRTRDRRDHNPELYQLSYAHQDGAEHSAGKAASRGRANPVDTPCGTLRD